MTVPWGDWKRQHPGTRVLTRDLGLLDGVTGNPYDRDPFAGYAERVNQGLFVFPVSVEKLDGRLRPGERVMAIQVGESHKAYALATGPDWLLNDTVGGEGVVVIGRAGGPAAVAYYSTVDGRTLRFTLNGGRVKDVETGSEWDGGGRAVSGPMAGRELTAVPSRTSLWFSLVGALPGIELHTPD